MWVRRAQIASANNETNKLRSDNKKDPKKITSHRNTQSLRLRHACLLSATEKCTNNNNSTNKSQTKLRFINCTPESIAIECHRKEQLANKLLPAIPNHPLDYTYACTLTLSRARVCVCMQRAYCWDQIDCCAFAICVLLTFISLSLFADVGPGVQGHSRFSHIWNVFFMVLFFFGKIDWHNLFNVIYTMHGGRYRKPSVFACMLT